LRRLAQTTGWILLLAIAALSVVPPPLRPITSLPHVMEHAAIYFLAGSAFGLSHPNRFLAWLAGLNTFALAIEIVQLWIPGRHARGLDVLVDVFSISVGLGIGMMLARRSTGSS
jgi:VanZ family protein